MLRNFVLALLVATFAIGCAHDTPSHNDTVYLGGFHHQDQSQRAPFDNVSYWDGDNVSGAPSIKINLPEQRAYFYKGGQLVGISIVSTGREGFGTTSGNFHIIQKDKDHVSSRFGDYDDANGNVLKKDIDRDKDPMPKGARYDGAKMPFFMRIVGGTGMHQGYLPGYPASHGCIRMPGFMAQKFFENVNVGTPVSVIN
ncbi:MAG TPA: L,D-transpeptidase family protein [Chthoniobacter sp.]|jgi:lipoprotein-anchoring transpeptidase ErfK/SrfK